MAGCATFGARGGLGIRRSPSSNLSGDAEPRIQFEQARERALATAPFADQPDIVLDVSRGLLEERMLAAVVDRLDVTADARLGNDMSVTFRPTAELTRLEPVPDREGWVDVAVRVEGPFELKHPQVGSHLADVRVELAGLAELAADVAGGEIELTASAGREMSVDTRVSGVPASLAAFLRQGLSERFFESVQGEVTVLASPDLPFGIDHAAVRVDADGATVVMRSGTASPGKVATSSPIEEGWRLRVAMATVVSLMRAEQFRRADKGKASVFILPEELTLQGSEMAARVRVWGGVDGRIWWRDAQVAASVSLRDGKLVVEPSDAELVGASPGAFWASPFVGMQPSQLVQRMKAGVEREYPVTGVSAYSDGQTVVRTTSVSASDDDSALHLSGVVEAIAP